MRTSQIIIFILIFLFDFWLTIIRPLYSKEKEIDGIGFILSMLRMMVIWGITISVTIGMNIAREEVKGKCPELEKLENVYKLKE